MPCPGARPGAWCPGGQGRCQVMALVGSRGDIRGAAFGHLSGADIMVNTDASIDGDIGMPLGGEVIAVPAQGHPDPHLLLTHPVSPVGSAPPFALGNLCAATP